MEHVALALVMVLVLGVLEAVPVPVVEGLVEGVPVRLRVVLPVVEGLVEGVPVPVPVLLLEAEGVSEVLELLLPVLLMVTLGVTEALPDREALNTMVPCSSQDPGTKSQLVTAAKRARSPGSSMGNRTPMDKPTETVTKAPSCTQLLSIMSLVAPRATMSGAGLGVGLTLGVAVWVPVVPSMVLSVTVSVALPVTDTAVRYASTAAPSTMATSMDVRGPRGDVGTATTVDTVTKGPSGSPPRRTSTLVTDTTSMSTGSSLWMSKVHPVAFTGVTWMGQVAVQVMDCPSQVQGALSTGVANPEVAVHSMTGVAVKYRGMVLEGWDLTPVADTKAFRCTMPSRVSVTSSGVQAREALKPSSAGTQE